MTADLKHILVFKTNIKSPSDVGIVEQVLNNETAVLRWNVDQKDVDNVLRIVSPVLTAAEITGLINNCGYECAELL